MLTSVVFTTSIDHAHGKGANVKMDQSDMIYVFS